MRYKTLYKIAKNLHRDHIVTDETLQQLLASIATALDVTHGCLMTFTNTGDVHQIFVLGADDDPNVRDRDVWQCLVNQGLIGYVYYSDRSVVVRDIHHDPRWACLADTNFMPNKGSAVGVPLKQNGTIHAVMLFMHDTVDYFSQADIDFLSEIEEVASHALANMHSAQHHAENSFDTRYEAIFEHTPVPVLLTDYDGMIIDANLKASEFLGFSRTVLRTIAMHDINILNLDEIETITDEEQFFPTSTYDIDGNSIPTLIRARRVKLDNNEYVEWVLQDISVQHELEQLRRDLTAMVYHDLRGPMGSIHMAISKLTDILANHENPAVIKILNLGLRSTQQVSRLVEALLDIQRLEGGSTILDKQASQIHEILADAFLLVQPIADHADISFQMDIAQVPEVSIDADMIKRVVINLMENAVKYTPTGSSITLKAVDIGNSIRISISDTGPGIPPEMLDSIFNKFSRVKYQNAPKGIGLGLAFCRLAVEAHGGKIWVESDGQYGSDFIFTIPLDFTTNEDLPDTAELTSDDDSAAGNDTQYATTA